jgi:hypothetical protein
MDATTITGSSVYIAGVSSALSEDNGVVTIDPISNLSYSTTYSVYIDSTVKSASGVPIGTPYSFTFTTLAAPGSNTIIKTGRKIIRKQ